MGSLGGASNGGAPKNPKALMGEPNRIRQGGGGQTGLAKLGFYASEMKKNLYDKPHRIR